MLPDLSVIWVIFFVLLLTLLLNQLLFKPLGRVMRARESAVQSARLLADKAAADAHHATMVFDARMRAARQDVAGQMENARRAAEAHRARLVQEGQQMAQTTLAAAAAQTAADVADARQRIDRESTELAAAIAERVLGRQTT